MTLLKRPVCIITLLIILTSSTGCWNRRELDSLGIVAGATLDEGEGNNLQLTVQVIKPAKIQSPGQGGGMAGESYLNLSASGQEVFDIARSLTNKASRKLYWPHNQVILIGEGLARKGVLDSLDFFIRDQETRIMVKLFVTKGPASPLLDYSAELENIPALDLAALDKNLDSTSFAPQVNLMDFAQQLLSKTAAPVAPLLEMVEEKGRKEPHISGTAVFKGDKLVGELGPYESRGMLWVTGKVKSGIVAVPCPDDRGVASLEILRASSKIVTEIKAGALVFTVKIKEEGVLGSQNCPMDLSNETSWNYLEQKQTEAIRMEMEASIRKAQELGTDFFGFGEKVHQKFPLLWKQIENDWEHIFPSLEVNLEIEAKLRRTGEVTAPITPK